MAHSPALNARIHKLLERLERFYDRIVGCHIVIDGPSGHPENGGVFIARMEVIVPGGSLNAISAPQTQGDAYAAVMDAFKSAKRQLTEFAKSH
jgi:ribosome-associated translation inhibitor RaiA